jgi:hypothetical protein
MYLKFIKKYDASTSDITLFLETNIALLSLKLKSVGATVLF